MKKINSLVLISLLVFLPINVSVAAEMFFKIDGIPGESTDHDHAGEIDVLSWSWGVVHPTSINRGGKVRGSGKIGTGSITISKDVDSSSPIILKSCTEGKHYREALLTMRKSDGSGIEYATIFMKDLVVSSVVTIGPSGGEDNLTENVTLNFGEVKTDYQPQSPDGSSAGNVETTWKVEKGEK